MSEVKSKTKPATITAAQKQAKAMKLRARGWSLAAIAAKLGYASPSGAFKAITLGLRRTLSEPAELLRTLELDRLDKLLRTLWPLAVGKAVKVKVGDKETILPPVPDMKAVDRVLKLMERRAALMGLDAPKGFTLTNPDALAFKVYAGFVPSEVCGPVPAATPPALPPPADQAAGTGSTEPEEP